MKNNKQYILYLFILTEFLILFTSGCISSGKEDIPNELIKAKIKEENIKNSLDTEKPQKDLIGLSENLISKGYYDVAAVQLQSIEDAKIKNSAKWNYLTGVCLREQKNYGSAVEKFEKSIAIDKSFSYSYNGLGLTYAMTGDTEKARDCFNRAIELNPARADFHNNAGYLEMKVENYEESIFHFKKALSIDSGFIKAVNNLAISLGMTGDDSGAMEILLKYNTPEIACNNMGAIYHMKGEERKAEEFYNRAQALKKASGSQGLNAAEILYDNTVSDWEIIDDGNIDGPSSWYISDQVIRQTSNIYGGEDEGGYPDKPGTYAVAGDSSWHNYSLSVNVSSDDDDAVGVIFRYADKDNYYRFSMDRSRKYRRLIKKYKGKISVLAEAAEGYRKGKCYPVDVVVSDSRIVVMIDDKVIFDVNDRDIKHGRIGLYSWGNDGCEFSYPVVQVKL